MWRVIVPPEHGREFRFAEHMRSEPAVMIFSIIFAYLRNPFRANFYSPNPRLLLC